MRVLSLPGYHRHINLDLVAEVHVSPDFDRVTLTYAYHGPEEAAEFFHRPLTCTFSGDLAQVVLRALELTPLDCLHDAVRGPWSVRMCDRPLEDTVGTTGQPGAFPGPHR